MTALHGLRGFGKTTLAAAYAERHRGDYRATWWIRAQTGPMMHADLAAPLTAASRHIQDRIQHRPQLGLARSAQTLCCRHMRLDQRPFGIR